MLSKQGKAKRGSANAKNQPRRPARNAGKPSRSQASRRTVAPSRNPRQKLRSKGGLAGTYALPPQVMQSVRPNPFPVFERAAPHEDFPEGGLRLGCFSRLVNLTTNAGSPLILGSTQSSICVSPNGAFVTTNTIGDFLAPTTDFVPQVARYFRRWRCRKMRLHYVPGVGTIVADWDGVKGITFSFDMDAPVLSTEATPTANTAVGARSISITPSMPCVFDAVIRQTASRDDELYFMSGAGDSVAITAQFAEVRQLFQGGVFVVADNNATAGSVVLGTIWAEYEFDVYGFTNQPEIGNIPALRKKRLAALAKREAEEIPDAGDSKRPSVDYPDADGDFVDLTPKSAHLSSGLARPVSVLALAAKEPTSASRPPSLKGTR